MKNSTLLLILFLALAFLSCDSVNSTEDANSNFWEEFLTMNNTLPHTTPPVQMTLNLSETEVSAGESIELAFDLENTSELDTLIILLGFSARHDFVVLDADSSVVWNRLPDITSLAQSGIYFEPNQVRTYTHTWDLTDELGNPVPKGMYYVFGGFTDVAYSNAEQSEKFEGPAATKMQVIEIN